LGDLESSPAADKQHVTVKRKVALKHRPPNDLINSIVAANVLAKDDELPVAGEESCRVESASSAEDRLLGAEGLWQLAKQIRGEAEIAIGPTQATPANGFDGSFAADSATRGSEEVSLKLCGIECNVIQLDFDNIAPGGVLRENGAKLGDMVSGLDDAFR